MLIFKVKLIFELDPNKKEKIDKKSGAHLAIQVTISSPIKILDLVTCFVAFWLVITKINIW